MDYNYMCDKLINKKELIFHLVKQNDEKIYHFLEEDKNLINCQDENGNSLLHWAVFLNNIYLVCYLLENKANVNIKSNIQQTPLFWAVCSNNIFMIYLLKKYGCNLNEVDNKGYNCLIICVQYNSILCFFYLLHLNISLTEKDFNNCSVFDWSAYNNNMFFLRLFSIFLNNFYSLHPTNPSSVLHKAIIGNAYEAVTYLILNNHQNIYDIATDNKETILEFIEENKSNINSKIYEFLKCKKTQKMCEKRKRITYNLYEPNGDIGPYTIKKKKNLSFLLNIYSKYQENKALLIYPFLLVLTYLYLNLVYFCYIRVKLGYKNIMQDIFHPFLFIFYYFAISSNPGYLENSKEIYKSKKEEMKDAEDNDKDSYDNEKEINENNSLSKQNFVFEYIIKNIKKEIKRYEKENKLCEFSKKIKNENIFELKERLNIVWDVKPFEISAFDINMLCPTCFLFKNLRTKHCRFCDKCIEIFDHHCVFTLNCMAIENARIFLMWILSNILFSLYILYIYIWLTLKFSFNFYMLSFYIILTAIILSILLIYFMGCVFLRSFFNILENITSNEKFKMYSSKKFFSYELKMGEDNQPFIVRKFQNPFDQGKFFNFLHFLTKSKDGLLKKKENFIKIDKNVKSELVHTFVENLNKKLKEHYGKK
ncbi:palmitoyltransferase, putative [Plasmodium gallinaceum]|uniref:Palmitoyltransferase n=1 Tax=Plasmodium gallinaceum TaxID=5849 RepID=A0A1J1GRM6_PLAGA|nr:palmitoyltransferase, putative [Plasmodium gallinaceum]CRG94947.1 palmitoyltransferase, putative [Plasmodium gallinaceum]